MKNISQRLQLQNNNRIPKMVRYKYRFMGENMYRFYRGNCAIFYEDLAASGKLTKGPPVWICGDLHLENFGSYKGNNGLVYFDLNDFDESVLAPACWEVARLATSIFIAFESLKIGQEKATRMAKLFIRSYANTLAKGKADYIEERTAFGIVRNFLSIVAKRKQRTILNKRTVGNKKLAKDHPKHFPIEKPLKKALTGHIENWLKEDGNSPYNYKVIDAVFRLAGTSSIGLERYAVLLKSSNDAGTKYLLLDMKESTGSSLTPYLMHKQPAWETEAHRILFAQQLMQNRTPYLLSSTVFNGKPFVIQEMQSTKDNINFKLIKKEYRAMCEVIDSMGMLTASAQLRSAGRKGSANADTLIAFGQDEKVQQEILDYALAYSTTVKKDYAAFKEDYKKGLFKPGAVPGKA